MSDSSEHAEKAAEFYREQTWKLVLERLDEVQREQRAQRLLIEKINQKWAYVYGIAAAVSVIAGLAWQWIMAKMKTLTML